MSTPSSPSEQRRSAHIHPALHPSVTGVPVTPGVSLAGRSNYIAPEHLVDGANDSQDREAKNGGLENGTAAGSQTNADSYFGAKEGANERGQSIAHGPVGQKDQRQGSSGVNGDARQRHADAAVSDPRAAYPDLNLNGSVISATTYVPYDLGYAQGQEWVRSLRICEDCL